MQKLQTANREENIMAFSNSKSRETLPDKGMSRGGPQAGTGALAGAQLGKNENVPAAAQACTTDDTIETTPDKAEAQSHG